MIGRKKKRQQDKNEEDEEGSLHKNGTLLAYQNKQLFTLVNQLQEEKEKLLREKEEKEKLLREKEEKEKLLEIKNVPLIEVNVIFKENKKN